MKQWPMFCCVLHNILQNKIFFLLIKVNYPIHCNLLNFLLKCFDPYPMIIINGHLSHVATDLKDDRTYNNCTKYASIFFELSQNMFNLLIYRFFTHSLFPLKYLCSSEI